MAVTSILLSVIVIGNSLSLSPGDWQFSAPQPLFAYALNGGVAFDFPVENGTQPRVNYFWTPRTKALAGNLIAAFSVTTSSPSVVFNYVFEPTNTCVTPAHVRLLMARSDYNKFNNPNFEDTRWWSNPIAAELVGGLSAQLTVPLTPDQWTNIYGHSGIDRPDGWTQMLKHPAMVGLSFGGGCFYGHGVNVSGGTAQFILWNYSVQ